MEQLADKQHMRYYFLILLITITNYCFSQTTRGSDTISKATDIVIGKKFNIHSTILNEDREILIYLPNSYKNNTYTNYPVVYLLDGGKFFNSFTGAVGQMSSDASPQIPEMIVVGINTFRNRVRDASPTNSLIGYRGIKEDGLEVSGGADNFLKFIKDELISHIDSIYRTNSYKTFVGYSFTGLPVLHSLFTQPDLFNSYLVIDFSAWWDNQITLKNYNLLLKTYKSKKPIDLFICTEDRVPNVVYPEKVNATWAFMKAVEKSRPANINYGFKKYKYKEENHHSMPLISFIDGLKYIFRGYMINYDEMYNSPKLIQSKFDTLSKRLGYKTSLREDLVNFFAYQFLYTHKDIKKALFYFKMNVENYPLSSNAHDGLAEAYNVNGDKAKAIEYYEKAVILNPNNQNSKKMLGELKTN